ncbi:uncharacterized protein LOC108909324 [Anoplophora glabripennis]|uniref:uncharacterized protein LOC108909324 n=1 Tax=Anoplophora glabripennis TaxID=217634 RepID=UPI000C78A62D|nr:uncharacterized protein LOC108909324 [Anoplophora glabripennis]
MGQLVPVFAAYLLLCFGIQYFRRPREVGPGPLVSSYIFMFAAFLLLWDIRLYPSSLRRLGIISQCIIEFLVASFLFENIMVDFWFPLELVVLGASWALADLLEEMLQSGSWTCDVVCDVLRTEKSSYAASYMLSLFFLLAVLHATRAIDLRELENGPVAFFGDIGYRTKRYFRRQKKYLGIGIKKRVHIRENKDRNAITAPSGCPSEISSTGKNRGKNNNKNSSGNKNNKRKSPCDNEFKTYL